MNGIGMVMINSDLIMEGVYSSAEEVQKLENKDPNQLDDEERLKLIGYYSKHYYCCEKAHTNIMPHIIWLIRTQPDYEFWIGACVEVRNRAAYLSVRRVWEDALRKNPDCASVHVNAAAFMLYHDPEFSRELFRKALKLNPEDKLAKSMLKRLDKKMSFYVEISRKFSELHVFVPGAVECKHFKNPEELSEYLDNKEKSAGTKKRKSNAKHRPKKA